jgi:hypothetical protein
MAPGNLGSRGCQARVNSQSAVPAGVPEGTYRSSSTMVPARLLSTRSCESAGGWAIHPPCTTEQSPADR